MKKLFLSFLLIFITYNAFCQDSKNTDYIITILNDTLYGEIENKKIFNARKIKLNSDNKTQKYKTKQLKEIQVKEERYIRQTVTNKTENIYIGRFTKPIIETGNIKVYQYKQAIILRKKNHSFLKNQLKYYANDYSETSTYSKQKKNSDSLAPFIRRYNSFKDENPNTKAFIEEKLHHKPFINPQVAINLAGIIPSHGYLGAELGLTSNLTLSPRLSLLLGRKDKNDELEIFPFSEVVAKYYLFQKNRIKKDKSSFKYSGYNISGTYMHPFQWYITKAARAEVGFKGVLFNNIFFDYNIGTIYLIDRGKYSLWMTVGFGYSF
jgi:hypothetical protein